MAGEDNNQQQDNQNNNQQSDQNKNQDQNQNKDNKQDQSDNKQQSDQNKQNQGNKDFKVPDAYKDKKWIGKIKSEDDLYKQIDELDTAVGKKAVMPDLEKATPKEREEYFKSVRPKDQKEYKFEEMESLTPELKAGFSSLLFESGIPAYQANQLIQGYNTMLSKEKAEMLSEDGFAKVMEDSFGKDYKPVSQEADKILKANLSDADYTELDTNIPNKYVGIMYRFADKIKKQYGINDAGKGGEDDPSGSQSGNIVEVRKDLRKKISELTGAGKQYKQEDLDVLQRQLEDTYGIKKKA